MIQLGIVFAFVALLGWGFGDFFIQKTTRIVGIYKGLFIIGASATVVLFPFVYTELWAYSFEQYQSLVLLGVVTLVQALIVLETFKRGKLSVVEPIIAVELPLTVGLGVFVAGEVLSLQQFLLFLLVFVGVVLASTSQLSHLKPHRRLLEKGVFLACTAALLSAPINFYIGVFAQTISPLVIVWVSHTMYTIFCGAYIILRGEMGSLLRALRAHPVPLLAQSIFDNAAWLGYAFAASIISISLAVTISEGYIALAALLGYFFGREKLGKHQVVGAIVAISAIMVLASTL